MPFALAFVAAAGALSPLFGDLAPAAVAVTPTKPAALAGRWAGLSVATRIATVAIHGCGHAPWLYGVTATADDRCTRVAQIDVRVNGTTLPLPVQAYASLGNVTHALLGSSKTGFSLYLRGAEGGAEDYGVTFSFDRRGLVERKIYWPDGTAERTSYAAE